VGAAPASSAPPSRWCSSWDAHQRGTHAGAIALPLQHMAEGRPVSRRSSSSARIYSASSSTVSAVCAQVARSPVAWKAVDGEACSPATTKDRVAFLSFPLGSCTQNLRAGLLFPVSLWPFL
jgi:hypothetical protein